MDRLRFLAGLVIFLIISFFATPRLTSSQAKTIRFLTAPSAGMAGGFISGASVFDAAWTTPTSRIALSGTAGFALFFFVFLFYDRVFVPDDAIEVDIPSGVTFKQALDLAAQLGMVTVDYSALQSQDLSQPMTAGHIKCKTLSDLFTILRLKTVTAGAIKNYSVKESNDIYSLGRP